MTEEIKEIKPRPYVKSGKYKKDGVIEEKAQDNEENHVDRIPFLISEEISKIHKRMDKIELSNNESNQSDEVQESPTNLLLKDFSEMSERIQKLEKMVLNGFTHLGIGGIVSKSGFTPAKPEIKPKYA